MEDIVVNKVLSNLVSDDSHSLEHFISVRDHANKAVENTNLDDSQKRIVIAAAFLHDVDDPKISKDVLPPHQDKWSKFVLKELGER